MCSTFSFILSEPFWLAKCQQDFTLNPKQKKIRWLERLTVEKGGTLYSMGGEDNIQIHNIICQARVIALSRFKFLLTFAEEKRILQEIRSLLDEDTPYGSNIPTGTANDVFFPSDKVDVFQSNDAAININSMEKTSRLDQNLRQYDVANIIEMKNFCETGSLANQPAIHLDKDMLRLLLDHEGDTNTQTKANTPSQELQILDVNYKGSQSTDENYGTEYAERLKAGLRPIAMKTYRKSDSDGTDEDPFQSSGSEYSPSSEKSKSKISTEWLVLSFSSSANDTSGENCAEASTIVSNKQEEHMITSNSTPCTNTSQHTI
nr:unnamed protein product [Callosobruchus analis]